MFFPQFSLVCLRHTLRDLVISPSPSVERIFHVAVFDIARLCKQKKYLKMSG